MNDKVVELLPDSVKVDFGPPRVFFKYNATVGNRICNYGKFLKNLQINDINKICKDTCSCLQHKDMIDSHHGHVINGDFGFIKDPNLKMILAIGPKFRFSKGFDKRRILKEIKSNLADYIERLSSKHKIDKSEFRLWRQKTIRHFKNCLFKLKRNSKFNLGNVNKEFILNHKELKALHKNFVITLVDKASNNYALICKKFYIETLMNELGFVKDLNDAWLINGNATYTPTTESSSDIVDRHKLVILREFELIMDEDNEILPKFYSIIKFHKSPIKQRFIAGAKFSTLKGISMKLNKSLICIREALKVKLFKENEGSNFNYFSSINSTLQFLNKMEKDDSIKLANVYDFSTLYTNLELNKVKDILFQLVDEIFDNYRRKFICVTTTKAYFTYVVYNNGFFFSKSTIKLALNLILFETYITFAGVIFKQIRGIPMGGNASPLIADLCLAYL